VPSSCVVFSPKPVIFLQRKKFNLKNIEISRMFASFLSLQSPSLRCILTLVVLVTVVGSMPSPAIYRSNSWHDLSPGIVDRSENIIVPYNKRSTMILDKLVYAFQKALQNEPAPGRSPGNPSMESEFQQERGNPSRRLYWRCYFNAVSCFRRK